MMNLLVTQAPAATAVSVADLKSNCRISGTDEDAFLGALLVRAQSMIEERIDRALGEQQLLLLLDSWPESGSKERWRSGIWPGDGLICLPRPPLVEVATVKYLDSEGVEQTVTATEYIVDTGSWPGTIFRVGSDWPTVLANPGPIRIAYTAGDPVGFVTPPTALQAILLLASNWYENREALSVGGTPMEFPWSVEALINISRWK